LIVNLQEADSYILIMLHEIVCFSLSGTMLVPVVWVFVWQTNSPNVQPVTDNGIPSGN